MSRPEAYTLGRYVPSLWQSEVIEVEIKKYLPPCCVCERVSVRYPSDVEPHYDNMQWHQDGGGPAGVTKHMVVWASEDPTHIRASDGSEFHFEPFDVIWFDNYAAFHKQPPNTVPQKRWFVSIRCSGEQF